MQPGNNPCPRRLLRGAAVLLLALLVYVCMPVSLGRGGPACGPELLGLHRFILDDITFFGRYTYPLTEVCRRHDTCYSRPGDTRSRCDAALYTELANVCAAGAPGLPRAHCRVVALTFYVSVRAFGGFAYDWDDPIR